MARAIWSGALAFGLVNVPVGLFSATQDKTVHFHQFQRDTSARIRYKRVNEDTGQEVEYDDIVKGADVGGGQYVLLDPEELEAVEPGRSRTIDISDFVDAAEIDPIYYQKTYYLAPQGEAAQRAYALLAEAMRQTERVAIATFVMRSKQYLAAIRPKDDVLTLETMFFADEVRDPAEQIDGLPTQREVGERDLDMAFALIDSMTVSWSPENYRDTYRERVEELIEAKRNNEEIVSEAEPAGGGQVVDLMEALEASVRQARGGHAPGNAEKLRKLDRRKAEPGDGGGTTDEQAGKAKRKPDRSAGTDSHELDDLTKDQLYQLAQDLDIPGRSSMSRRDLAKAVGKARRAAQRAS